jgi:holo-[acyl-carrier protein] synthase
MIVGIGHDMCHVPRIQATLERFGERFTARIFTPIERQRSDVRMRRAESYAKRFAAKEALAKAMGTGVPRHGVHWSDMGVVNDRFGKPGFVLSGGAERRFIALTPPLHHLVAHLSITDDGPWAVAHVVLEARPVIEARDRGLSV